MKPPSAARLELVLAGLLAINPATAQELLDGYGNYPYDPLCAETCLRSLTSYMLDCSDMAGSDMMVMSTSPQCYASSTPFLTSVAWCISTKCAEWDIPTSEVEAFWEEQVTGSRTVAPKWSYSLALVNVNPQPPTYQLNDSDTWLNVTSIVAPDIYLGQWNALGKVLRESVLESAYSIAIFVTGVGMPIALACLGYMPFVGNVFNKVKPYLIYPSTIGTYQVRPLPLLLGNAPTLGQSLYIFVFVVLNVVLCAVQYQSGQPNAWFGSQWREISAYVMYRTGDYAFMLLPLIVLFSSRNNVLLWLSNWSHSTYILLHRWVARIFMLYVVIHSIIGLQIYAEDATTSWWIWGAVATLSSVILTLASGLYVRKFQYELFLISHIVLAVFVIVGSWYHIIQWYASMGEYIPNTSGYEVWLFFAIAVWFSDRLVRVARVLKWGPRRAEVTDLGGGYVRLDIPNVRWGADPGQHVYAYFPTLSPLRPWENHPFSIIPTPLLQLSAHSDTAGSSAHEDTEKNDHTQTSARASYTGIGITLFVKKSTGLTRYLQPHRNLLTLLDGPYSNNQTKGVLRCDRVLLVGGGIGITGLLPWAHSHWNVKLAWSVKDSAKCLVQAIDLSRVADKEVRVGGRFNVNELIAQEVEAGWGMVGVVVSGPGGLCDSVRAAVVAAGRRSKTVFELEVDSYSW